MLTNDQVRAVANFDATAVAAMLPALGAVADNTAAGAIAPVGTDCCLTFLLPDAATADYDFVVPEKLEVVDVVVIKDAAGAANTIQVKTGAAVAISDAIAAAVDKAVTRAGTLDKATRVIAAGGTMRITNTRAAGSSAAFVRVVCIRRA